MSDVHQDFMSEWARNNGKTAQQRTVTQETKKYETGTLPLNMYQTEEQIGEQLPFDGASEEREKAIEGDKYSDESVTDPDSYLNDDEFPRQNLSFLRTTSSGRNISFNKKYGGKLFLSVVFLDEMQYMYLEIEVEVEMSGSN